MFSFICLSTTSNRACHLSRAHPSKQPEVKSPVVVVVVVLVWPGRWPI